MLREAEHHSHGLLHLGSMPYKVKNSKSCLQGDKNEPQSHWGEAETIVRGETERLHRVPPGLPGIIWL